MEIKESNKMIAEFMGYKYFPYDPKRKSDGDYIAGWHKNTIGSPKIPNWYLVRRTPELRFSNEWNWLMPVVQKIENLGFTVWINKRVSTITKDRDLGWGSIDRYDRSTIENTYEAIVRFIIKTTR